MSHLCIGGGTVGVFLPSDNLLAVQIISLEVLGLLQKRMMKEEGTLKM